MGEKNQPADGTKPRKADLNRIIRQLNEERRRISRIIESLESMAAGGEGAVKPPSRRGRRFMNPEDRIEVSKRMKRYWARRREENTGRLPAQPDSAPGETGGSHGAFSA